MIRSLSALARARAIELAGLVVGVIFARSMFLPGTIGFAFDWNVPATAAGLRAWGSADLLPLWSTEFGLLVAYPTELYVKLAFWIGGLLGLPGNLATALFLTAMFALCFVGMARFVKSAWGSTPTDQAVAGLLYTASPVLFSATVTGYLTFIFSYAMMPWMLYHLVLAVRGEKRSWLGYAFFLVLSLSQIQYVVFDIVLVGAVLLGLRANLRQCAVAAGAALISSALGYSFIFWNIFVSRSIVGATAALSGHSWTSLDTPGLVKAFLLVPSVYPYFDLALGPLAVVWHVAAIIWVAASLYFGFTSRRALGKPLAVLLVIALLFLNGTHWPTGGLFTWLLNLPGFAPFRNVNYVFGIVSFSVSALVVLWLAGSKSRTVWPAMLLLVAALIWSSPFLVNQYTQWVTPIPNVSGVETLIGPASRTLVFPHNEVIDKSHPTLGGIDPYSVQTITPIFVRDTGTGAYDAVLEDRIVDWTPTARNLIGATEAGGVNSITLHTGLDSLYSRYVNAYDDLWLWSTYSSDNFAAVLDKSGLSKATSGSTSVYSAPPASAAEEANAAAILDGSIEDEIAMRASGFQAVYVPSIDLHGSKPPSWTTAFVQSLNALPIVASEYDANEGAALSAGRETTGAADFHKAWVSLLGSQNWWLASRLMQEPHAAITTDAGAVLRVPVPPGARHVWIQYFASAFGGSLEIKRAAFAPRIIDTNEASFGAYYWLDLGTVSGGSPDLDIRSLDGFNAVGRILMLTPDEERIDRGRFAAFAALPTVRVLPDVTFAGRIPFNVFGTGKASLLLTNVSQPIRMSLSARLLREADDCHLQIADVQFPEYRLSLDGHGPQQNGSFVDAGSFQCGATTNVLLEGRALTQAPRRITLRGPRLRVGDRSIALRMLPLAFQSVSSGTHVLSISYAPLIDYTHQHWSAAADATFPATPGNAGRATARRTDSGVVIDLATQKDTINTFIPLRRLRPGEIMVLTGSYKCSPGSSVRFDFLAGAKQRLTYEAILGGDGTTRDFHMWMSSVQVPNDVDLFVYLVPGGAPSAAGEIVLNDALPVVSADLLVAALPISIPAASFSAVHTSGYDEVTLVEPKRVVQYDQTFDPRWQSRVAAQHLETQTGFNLFVGPQASNQDTITYAGARTFFWLAAFSTAFTLGLGISALLLGGRFGRAARKKHTLA